VVKVRVPPRTHQRTSHAERGLWRLQPIWSRGCFVPQPHVACVGLAERRRHVAQLLNHLPDVLADTRSGTFTALSSASADRFSAAAALYCSATGEPGTRVRALHR
jgi:hypothetical protein